MKLQTYGFSNGKNSTIVLTLLLHMHSFPNSWPVSTLRSFPRAFGQLQPRSPSQGWWDRGVKGVRGAMPPSQIFPEQKRESDKLLLMALPDFLTFLHNLCYLHPPRGQISTLVCVCRYATEIQKDKFSLNSTNNLQFFQFSEEKWFFRWNLQTTRLKLHQGEYIFILRTA